MRLILFLAVVLLVFLPFNWLSVRQLRRIHPRRKRWIGAAVVGGNLLWPFLPLLQTSSPLSRMTRSILGPVWFGWTSFAVLYSFFLALVLLTWALFARKHPFAEFARWPSRVFVGTLIAGFLVGCYQALVPLRIERVPIRVAGLPPSLAGTRIALLSDLHVGLFTRESRLDAIFTATNELRPSVVLLAGDLIDDDPYFVPKLLKGTRTLDPATPIFAVLGNHEMYGDPLAVIDSLEGSRIRLLVNDGASVRDLWIAGVSDRAATQNPRASHLQPDLARALAGKPAAGFPVVLSHQPSIAGEARRRGLPLVVCGHTHGGQLGFRPLRWSLAGVFLPYHMGHYSLGSTQLYVNTGTGYWLFPFRLGMTPEITLIELAER